MASLYMIGRIVPYSFNNAIHSSGVGIYIVPIISLISSVLSFCLCVSFKKLIFDSYLVDIVVLNIQLD